MSTLSTYEGWGVAYLSELTGTHQLLGRYSDHLASIPAHMEGHVRALHKTRRSAEAQAKKHRAFWRGQDPRIHPPARPGHYKVIRCRVEIVASIPKAPGDG